MHEYMRTAVLFYMQHDHFNLPSDLEKTLTFQD